MVTIYNYTVDKYGEEEKFLYANLGKTAFINCIFVKNNIDIPFPKWRFSKQKYIKELLRFGITTVKFPDYSLINTLFYRILSNIENYDCICLGMLGFANDDLFKIKEFLEQIQKNLDSKIIILVFKNGSFEESDIFSEFPFYPFQP